MLSKFCSHRNTNLKIELFFRGNFSTEKGNDNSSIDRNTFKKVEKKYKKKITKNVAPLPQ